jgi:hypothetical protein
MEPVDFGQYPCLGVLLRSRLGLLSQSARADHGKRRSSGQKALRDVHGSLRLLRIGDKPR